MEWVGLGVLIFLGLLFLAPDVLLFPIGYAFAGMMEPTKSPRLLHCGIALALFGPTLIGSLFILGGLLQWLGLIWPARGCGIAAVVLLPAWVLAGIVVGIMKSRHKRTDEQTTRE
jgi:hypothetical protein